MKLLPLVTCIGVALTLTACGGNSNNSKSSSSISSASSSVVSSVSSEVSSVDSSSSSSEISSAVSSAISSELSSSSVSSNSSIETSSSSAISSTSSAISSTGPINSSSSLSSSSIQSSVQSSSSSLSSSVQSSVSSSVQSSEASSSSVSSAQQEGWQLVWSDEFDGEEIDRTKWENEVNCWGGGNEEFQCYTNKPKNSYIENGILKLEAHRELNCGPAVNQEDPTYNPNDMSVCKPFSSARLRTRNMGDWKYGRMEIRAKLPFGKGLWPAIWALPSQTVYGGWPHSGEIDILEIFAPGHTDFGPPNEIHGTLHYGFSWPWNQNSGAGFTPETNVWEDFYTYSIEWEEGEIRWYVDDHHFATQTSNGWFIYYWDGQEHGYKVGKGAQPFDQLFHIVLNVAVGSSFLPAPDANGVFPQAMEVEYVRVYQCANDPVTGKGCATVNPDVVPIVGHAPLADEFEEIVLFRDGPQSVNLGEWEGAPLLNTLNPGFWSPQNTIVSNPAFNVDGQTVWDIRFNTGVGSAFLTVDDMHIEGLEQGISFGGDNLHNRARQLGEFKFDLRVLNIAPGTKLRVKLDSGWPKVSFHEIVVPPLGQWAEVSVRFNSLRDNDIDWGSVDYTKLTNLFVIEPNGNGGLTHVQLNNIRIVCQAFCDQAPVVAEVPVTDNFSLFEGGVVNQGMGYELGQFGGAAPSIAAAINNDGGARANVLDLKYPLNVGIAFIQSAAPKDLSTFIGGKLKFDLYVETYGTNLENLIVEVHGNNNGNGVVDIGRPAVGQWHTIELPLGQGQNSLNAAFGTINTPFGILPFWGGQGTGVHLQVDNVRWEVAD